jgi:glycosyltransferase involved in cell wall biosynthesis
MARFLFDSVASIPEVHEIIIVAAESSDDTVGVAHEIAARRPEVRVLANPKKGPASGRNIGLREATGDVIAFNDADDIWPRGRLALQLERLDREPPADVVAGLVTYFEELDRDTLAPRLSSRVETVFIHQVGSMLFRRSVFDRLGCSTRHCFMGRMEI